MREFLTGQRIERAKELPVTTGLPVSAVGASVGYELYATFARRFRELTGLTPGAYRRAAQG